MKRTFSWLAAAAAVALIAGAGPLAFAGTPSGLSNGAGPARPSNAAASSPGGVPYPLPMATGDPRPAFPPRVPRACVTLGAALPTGTGVFSSADETNPPDTSRIQAALDRCAGTGRAVELSADGADDAFLSGPLTIERHEVLLVQDGVTLYASLNPVNYQIPSQYPANTCGTVSAAGGGCSPFITFGGSDSGLMGTSDTGIQVKTDANSGGLTQQVTYRDIYLINIKHLLIFNPHYSSGGTSVPTQRDIVLDGVVSTDSESGAYSIFEGFDAANPLQIDLENIDLDNITQDGNHGNEDPTEGESPTQYVQAGTYNTNIVPAGPLGNTADDVTVTPIHGFGSVPACSIPAFGPPPEVAGS